MSEQYTVKAVLEAYDKGFSSGMKKAADEMKGMESTSDRLGSKLKSGLGFGVLMGIGTKAVNTISSAITSNLGGAIKRFDTLNNFPKIMKNLGYSSDDAKKAMDKMAAGIDGLPTALDDIAGAATKIAPLTGNLDKATDVTLALNNALLAGGKDAGTQANALEQFSQMMSAGKVDMQAWRSMLSAMPGQMDQLSKAILGADASQTDLYEAMKHGDVTFQDFNDALIKLNKEGLSAGGKKFGSFEKQAKDATQGIGTAVTNMRTRVIKGLTSMIETANKKFKVADAINTFSTSIKNTMDNIAKSKTFIKVLSLIKKGIQTIVPVVKAWVSAFGKVIKALVDTASESTEFGSIIQKVQGYLIKFAEFVGSHAEQIAKLTKAVLLLWVAFKGGMIVNTIAKGISALIPAAAGFIAALGPVGLIATGLIAAGTAFYYLKKHMDGAKDSASKYTEEEKKMMDAIDKDTEKRKELNKETNEKTSSVDAEFNYVDELVKEHDRLIGSNGKVKKGYEDRVNYIRNELAKTLGVEREEIDKVIDKNGKLEESIDKIIAKKKAEAYLDVHKEKYTNAKENESSLRGKYATEKTNEEEWTAKAKELKPAADKIKKQIKDIEKDTTMKIGEKMAALQMLRTDKDLVAYREAEKKAKTFEKKRKDAYKNWIPAKKEIEQYEGLQFAVSSNNYKDIDKYLNQMTSSIKTAGNATYEELKKQYNKRKAIQEQLEKDLKNGVKGVTKEDVAKAKEETKAALKELNTKSETVEVDGKIKYKWQVDEESAKQGANKTSTVLGTAVQKVSEYVNEHPANLKPSGKKTFSSFVIGALSMMGVIQDAGAAAPKKAATAANKQSGGSRPAGKNFITSLLLGMNDKMPKVEPKGEQVVREAKRGLKGSNTAGYNRALELMRGYLQGIKDKIVNVWNAAFNVGATADDGLKEGQKSGSPSKKAIKRGKEFVKGYSLSIANSYKSVAKTAANLAKTAVDALAQPMKNNKSLKPWNKNFNDQVSKYMETFKSKLESAGNKLKKEYDENFNINEIERAMHSKSKSSWVKSVKKYFGTKELSNSQRTGLENMQRKFENILDKGLERMSSVAEKTLTKLADKYQQAYDKIIAAKDTFENNLKAKSALYRTDTYGFFEFTDWNAQIKEINKVKNNLKKLQSWGIGQDFIDAIGAMSIEDQTFYTNKLLALGQAGAKAQAKGYADYMAKAKSTANTIYKPYVDALDLAYNKELNTVLQKLQKKMVEIGQSMGKGMINGLNGKFIKRQLKSISTSMASTIINTLRSKLGIHSPSRVMAQMGEMTGRGLIKGLDAMQSAVMSATDNLISIPELAMADAPNFNGAYSAGYTAKNSYTIEVPLYINGREFARATATDMNAEITKRNTQINRTKGIL